jgi:hypothetical protein
MSSGGSHAPWGGRRVPNGKDMNKEWNKSGFISFFMKQSSFFTTFMALCLSAHISIAFIHVQATTPLS